MIDSENDTSIFENHADDFFEYAARQTQIIENDPLCEVKRYLDEPIAIKTTNVLEWWKHNKDQFPNLAAIARDFLLYPQQALHLNRCLVVQVVLLMIVMLHWM